MVAPFAARQARLNAAVLRHLSDVEGQLDGVTVQGIFAEPYLEALGGIAATGPTLVLDTALCTELTPASQFVCPRGTFRVRTPQADGAGLTTLPLERLS
ncbi:MAG: hypothetical protein LW768_19375 [Rubrivivax sp.]|jgi:hypothetical protein|nr:hypothetical protein [Rubrivivax sp.]